MKNSPITNTIGCILLLLGLLIYMLPVFIEVKKDYTVDAWYVPLILCVIGLSLILIPDKVVRGLSKLIDRKVDQL
jgi:hypothetical protein